MYAKFLAIDDVVIESTKLSIPIKSEFFWSVLHLDLGVRYHL